MRLRGASASPTESSVWTFPARSMTRAPAATHARGERHVRGDHDVRGRDAPGDPVVGESSDPGDEHERNPPLSGTRIRELATRTTGFHAGRNR